ncbi:hypothetical protein SUGI_0094250 [Cryptomeria japonica]|nr:hypothetical protein SUGI_0094250 [Cryptomeria japonica]
MAFKPSDELMMMVGTVVLTMFTALDLYKAYTRGAKWLPGNFLLLCGLCVQLLGYLDIQHLSFASRHKEHDLEAVVARQLSIDLSRLVLFVFVGYLLPGLASAKGLWSNTAALTISLSSHIAMELLAFQTYVIEKDKVVKGQSGIWLIAYYYVLLNSILGLLFLTMWAIGSGRFIRDNLSSRIPSVLSGNDNNEVSTWSREAYESEILKSWIVTRVCQPEYVLGRTMFSAGVGIVLTNCVGVFSDKVICLRSQLHGPLPLLTLQFIFITVVWFSVMYRWYSAVLYCRKAHSLSNFRFSIIFICIANILERYLEIVLPESRLLLIISLVFCIFPVLFLYLILCPIVLGLSVVFYLYFQLCNFSWRLSGVILSNKFVERLCGVETEPSCEEEFSKYKPTLELLCGPNEDPKSLWVAKQSSFEKIKKSIKKKYEQGTNSEALIKVIRKKPGGDYYVRRVQELLEPLKSVEMYFPLLKDSFRGIKAISILLIVHELKSGLDEIFTSGESIENDCSDAYEQAAEVLDFVDCPDGVGINVDVLRTKNVEAFELRSSIALHNPFGKMKFVDFLRRGNVHDTTKVDLALSFISELQGDKVKELKRWKLLEEQPDAEVLNTQWIFAAKPYGMYKVCEIILKSHRPVTLQNLLDDLSDLFAELIAHRMEESQKILLSSTKKWAKKFREDKITEGIQIVGFVRGVKDAVQKHNTTVADRAV